MNLLISGARIPVGRNPNPTMNRLGFRISRTCETSDSSMSVPSTGVASTHIRISIPMERSRIFTNEYPNPYMYVRAETSNLRETAPATFRTRLKLKWLSMRGPSTVTRSTRSTLS